jgi:hypothetical protein
MSLCAIFFDVEQQRMFINAFVTQLQQDVSTQPHTLPPITPPIKKSYKTPRNPILTYDCTDHTADTLDSLPDRVAKLQQYFAWTTTIPDINRLHGIWAVLIILYVSKEAQTAVSTHTHPDIAHAYFTSFNRRFELYLCGQLCHNKEGKQSELTILAKTPTEIIAQELIEITQLSMKFPS